VSPSTRSVGGHSHRYALAFLAAHADAFIEFQIVADHGHAQQHIGAIAHDVLRPLIGLPIRPFSIR